MKRIVVATRKSALALAQCRAWLEELRRLVPGLETEELHVTTTGDRVQDRALSEIGGKGLFVKEIEEAILDGRADIAVHSMKDVPPALAPGLVIGCVPRREDPRDVAVTRSGASLADLASGARIGTSSLRRQVQLLGWRSDVVVEPLRGNVDTRLRKCAEGVVDAIVLARAGLVRLGIADRATEVLEPERFLPAIGQGALAVEQRAGDARVAEILAPANHAETALAVAAERGVLEAVGGDCKTPIAAYAVRRDGRLWLRALLAEPDATNLRRREVDAPWPELPEQARAVGVELGRRLSSG